MDPKHQPWAPAAMAMDVEKQASHPREATELDAIASAVGEEGRRSSRAADVLCVAAYGLVAACYFAFFMWLVWLGITEKDPNYTLAVAAVSGLDPLPTHIGGRPALDPQFSLTVGIVPRSVLGWPQCDESTTTLKVAYHGYELASAPAPQICDLWRRRRKTTIVVRGSRVRLPGHVLDGLAADVRRAAGVLDVTLAIRLQHPTARHVYGLLVSCMGRRVGDDAGALCDMADLQL